MQPPDRFYSPRALTLDEIWDAIRPPPLKPVSYDQDAQSYELPGSSLPEFAADIGGLGLQQPQPSFGDRLVDNALEVAGKLWTFPNTALGLAYGGLGTVGGLLVGTHPQVRFGHNAVEFLNNPLVDRTRAFTLGNTIVYGRNIDPKTSRAYGDPNVTFGPHEEGHTYQAQALGPFYAPAYLLGGGFSGLEGNVFEKAAQRYGGGRGSWWPWQE